MTLARPPPFRVHISLGSQSILIPTLTDCLSGVDDEIVLMVAEEIPRFDKKMKYFSTSFSEFFTTFSGVFQHWIERDRRWNQRKHERTVIIAKLLDWTWFGFFFAARTCWINKIFYSHFIFNILFQPDRFSFSTFARRWPILKSIDFDFLSILLESYLTSKKNKMFIGLLSRQRRRSIIQRLKFDFIVTKIVSELFVREQMTTTSCDPSGKHMRKVNYNKWDNRTEQIITLLDFLCCMNCATLSLSQCDSIEPTTY